MEKYIWTECAQDFWPNFKTISAPFYTDGVEKVITLYGTQLDDDYILDTVEDWEQLREYLNDKYNLVLSDLENIEEL